jgi:type IV secretion system protein VirB3
MNEKLLVSPIFAGLTRPAMFLGVTLDYISISSLAALCFFIIANNPIYLIAYLPLHIVGWLACRIDHNIFRIMAKQINCAYSPNKKYWGCQSYEPF